MTSILNINNIPSSDITVGAIQNLSNAKISTTLLIQPPSATNTSDLLVKRTNSLILGDLLSKKVKTPTANTSENNSIQQSPNGKDSKDVVDYEPYENQSEIEEVPSPSKVLIPQRSFSTPIFSSMFSNNLNRNASQSSHKQILNALETLQKNLIEYQVLKVRDTIIKAQMAQSLVIPPLRTAHEAVTTPVKKLAKIVQDDDEDEPEIYYGEVEYPLLHLASKAQQAEESKKAKANNKVKGPKGKKISKLSNCSSPSNQDDSLLESLTATRAGTQRDEPEMVINLRELSEQISGLINKKSKKAVKTAKAEEKSKIKEAVQKVKKAEKKVEKEKKKSKKGASNVLLSPMSKGRKMTERKKNRWQKDASPASENIEVEAK